MSRTLEFSRAEQDTAPAARLAALHGYHPFLDNLRYAVIITVVMIHFAFAYAPVSPEAFVLAARRDHTSVLDALIAIRNVFGMPLLLCISGLLTYRSLTRTSSLVAFSRDKVRRYAVPLLFTAIFVGPIVPYVRYALKTPDPIAFVAYWTQQIRGLVGVAPWDALPWADRFHVHHLWFVSLLLVLMLSAAAIYRFTRVVRLPVRLGPLATLALLVVFNVAMHLFSIFVLHIRDGYWASFLNGLLAFEANRVWLLASFFAWGAYLARQIEAGRELLPLRLSVWATVSIVATAAFAILVGPAYAGRDAPEFLLDAGYVTARVIMCIAISGLLLRAAAAYWNRDSAIGRILARNSYNVYLVHMPVVVALQWLFLRFAPQAQPIAAAFVGGVIAVAATYLICEFLVRDRPKIAVAAGLGVFILEVALL